MDDIPINTFFQIAGSGHATRHTVTVIPGDGGGEPISHSNRNLVKPKAKSDIRKYSFSHRVIDPWNSLPTNVKNANDVNNFKNLYDNYTKSATSNSEE